MGEVALGTRLMACLLGGGAVGVCNAMARA